MMPETFAIDTAESVSEPATDTVVKLILALAGRRSGGAAASSTSLSGLFLGLVGFDGTARAVARRVSRGFGMRVLVHGAAGVDRLSLDGIDAEISPSLDALLATADMVSLHGNASDVVIDVHGLNRMKADACLINARHGGLIDEQALLHALWFETIGGAGFAVQPDTLDRLQDFRCCDNAIVLPPPTAASAPEPARSTRTAANVVPLFESRALTTRPAAHLSP